MKTRMNGDALSLVAMRVSRTLATLAFVAGLTVFAGWTFFLPSMAGIARALPPPLAALAIALLASAILLIGLSRAWARRVGYFLAASGGALALQAIAQTATGADFGTDALLFGAAVASLHGGVFPHPGRIAAVVALMLSANAVALLLVPFASRRAASGFAIATGAGLLLVTTSLVGLALDNASLASLGFDRVPTLAATLLSAMLLLGTLRLRRDAGWLSVLWQASATGGLARGMVTWTVLAPLAIALIALAGVRAGFFSLDFAFALLAAAMCGGLTFLVLWNATRVDRATRRAEAAREAAQLAANRLRLAQTATGVQMWEWSARTRQWLSLDGEQRFDPSTNEYLEAGLARCLRDGNAEFEFPVRRAGIEDQWMLATCWREMRDGFAVVAGVNVDVTERKLAIFALEASETRLQLAARALPGFVYDWNRASGKLMRTSGIELLLGYAGAEISLASRWWDELIHPDDVATARPARVAAVSSADSTVDNIACEYRVRHRGGNYVWIWDHCILVRDRSGEVTRVVGSVLDITDRKETLARLAASERQQHAAERTVRENLQRLELALDAASVGMWDWDLDHDRMSWTRQTHLITGISETRFTGDPRQIFALLLPDDPNYAATLRAEMTRAGVVRETELEIRRPDGTRRWVQQRFTALRDDGRVRRIIGTLRDVTTRRMLESGRESLLNAERAARAELGAAGQAKDEFLATISHELRTPLNAILGWATLLQRPNVDPAMIGDGLKVIERNARAQTALLGDLLDANQMMSGKLSLTFEPMDLNDAVRATLDSLRVTIATRRIRVESQLGAAALPVMGDSGRLQQIVGNLLSNALKFTPPDGVVTITTGADDAGVSCEVRDSGEGIAAEFLPHIFEKFRQAEGGSSRKFAGLGLGLAITKQLVESHGGSISVSSEGRGRGAVFTVRLPRLRADSDVPDLDAHRYAGKTDKPLAGLTILAVDDEADSREYLERLLSEQGAEIVSVASAREAIDAIGSDSGRFNLLVSDIGMPGSTGYDLIDTVRHHLKVDGQDLPAVALTAFTRAQDRTQALERGFQSHLSKPVQVGRLIGAIRQLTRRGPVDPRKTGVAKSGEASRARTH